MASPLPTGGPIVLDDVEAGLSQLTDFGIHVVEPIATAMRNAILIRVAAQGWQVVHHAAFVHWATAQVDPDLIWVVLDPLT